MSSLVLTVTETLRYRGAIGQLNWALHRITGLGIVFFLILHVVDTSWSVFFPAEYVRAIAEYQTPLFTVGEFALVAAVVYHALNGFRITILDYKPDWWKYQERAGIGVLLLSGAILLPVWILMFRHVNNFYFGDESHKVLPLIDVITSQIRFFVGMGIALALAMVYSVIHEIVVREDAREKTKPVTSKVESFWWSYMRVSGILIIPLVFGHLAIMHIIQGVFDIIGETGRRIKQLLDQAATVGIGP